MTLMRGPQADEQPIEMKEEEKAKQLRMFAALPPASDELPSLRGTSVERENIISQLVFFLSIHAFA